MAITRKIGLIDLGTNSVRFDAHRILSRGTSRLIHREKLMVRLGENLFTSGRLDPDAVNRTIAVLRAFSETGKRLGVSEMIAFATSAVRDARDGKEFCERVLRETGLAIQVISGEDEARWIAAGVLSHRKATQDFALVDIGGGSTEISLCLKGQLVKSVSLPLGVARLQQVFLKTVPPSASALAATRNHLKETLAGALIGWPELKRIVGSSGTVRSLAKIAGESKTGKLTQKFLTGLVEAMTTLDADELEEIPGMEPKRRDLILAGGLVLEAIMLQLGARRATATKFSLRDGMLEKILRSPA